MSRKQLLIRLKTAQENYRAAPCGATFSRIVDCERALQAFDRRERWKQLHELRREDARWAWRRGRRCS